MSKFCELNANIKHIGEVSTSRVDGSPTGAEILTSTNAVTGDVRDTLDGKLKKFDDQLSSQSTEFDEHLDSQNQQFQDRFNTLAPIPWTPNTEIKANQSLQVFEHDGLFYLPNVKLLPFTTGEVFNADNWFLSELMTQMKHWRDVGDVRGWGAHSITDEGYENFDSTVALRNALSYAEIHGKSISAPYGIYKCTDTLTFSGVSANFNGSILRYYGEAGSWSAVFNSRMHITNNGSMLENVSFENMVKDEQAITTESITITIPSLPPVSTIQDIGGGGTVITIDSAHAKLGDMVVFDTSAIPEWIGLTGYVDNNGVITINISNYIASTYGGGVITTTVSLIHNARHGLNVGGSMPRLKNVRVIHYTGVSVGVGSLRGTVSGVKYLADQKSYYGDYQVSVTPAEGYGIEIPTRNNVNTFDSVFLTQHLYGKPNDTTRFNCINQIILSGIVNTFTRCDLETKSSSAGIIFAQGATRCTAKGYIEYKNTAEATIDYPYIKAERQTAGNVCDFYWWGNDSNSIVDLGVSNSLSVPISRVVNGTTSKTYVSNDNLLSNSAFLSGQSGWTVIGASDVKVNENGGQGGNSMRVAFSDNKLTIQQIIKDRFSVLDQGGVNITVSCWIRSDVNVEIRIDGLLNGGTYKANSGWQFIHSVVKVNSGWSGHVQFRSRESDTGYIEIANTSCTIGADVTSAIAQASTSRLVTGSKLYDVPDLNTGESVTTTVPLFGVSVGDACVASLGVSLQGLVMYAHINEDGVATITITNPTDGIKYIPTAPLKVVAFS